MLISQNSFTPTTRKEHARAKFIVIDGVNGAGKSTLIKSITAYLEQNKISLCNTREPGSTPLGLELRKLLLENAGDSRSHLAETFLFAADRAEHVTKVIRPALTRGEFVLSDRYYYSTVAFQGYGRGLGKDLTVQVNQIAIQGVVPDLVLILDLPVEEGLRRAAARNKNTSDKDSFEAEELAFHERLRAGFLTMAKELPEPFVVLDALKTPQQLFEEAQSLLSKLL